MQLLGKSVVGNGVDARWITLRHLLGAALGGESAGNAAMSAALGSHLIEHVHIPVGAVAAFAPFHEPPASHTMLLQMTEADLLLLRLFYAEDFNSAANDNLVACRGKFMRWLQYRV